MGKKECQEKKKKKRENLLADILGRIYKSNVDKKQHKMWKKEIIFELLKVADRPVVCADDR
jgi:hypothetical protein